MKFDQCLFITSTFFLMPPATGACWIKLKISGGIPDRSRSIADSDMTLEKMLETNDRLGAVAPGKHADRIAVTSNPQKDISALRSIGFVMKYGPCEALNL